MHTISLNDNYDDMLSPLFPFQPKTKGNKMVSGSGLYVRFSLRCTCSVCGKADCADGGDEPATETVVSIATLIKKLEIDGWYFSVIAPDKLALCPVCNSKTGITSILEQ